MNPEVIEVPRTLVPTLIAVFNKVLLYGQDLNYSKKTMG